MLRILSIFAVALMLAAAVVYLVLLLVYLFR